MGSFQDLPNDIKWLIMRLVIIGDRDYKEIFMWERGYNAFPSHKYWDCNHVVCNTRTMSLINKTTLRIVQSKCKHVYDDYSGKGWVFKAGALTEDY